MFFLLAVVKEASPFGPTCRAVGGLVLPKPIVGLELSRQKLQSLLCRPSELCDKNTFVFVCVCLCVWVKGTWV